MSNLSKVIIFCFGVCLNFSSIMSMNDNPGAGSPNKCSRRPIYVKIKNDNRAIIKYGDEITQQEKAELVQKVEDLRKSALRNINQ